jgi:DMSO/TMAO reductase YedYZ molybdopterin-dependent catalytic subunit
MPRRLTNDLLLTLILLQVLGGVLGWALPVETARPLYDVHRALGVALLLVLGWKQAIVLASLRRRLPRRDRTTVWGAIAAVGLMTTLALGLAWTLNLVSFDWLWGYSPLNVHVIVGIGLVPLVAVHVRARWRQNAASAPIRSRRALLRVSGIAFGTLVGWQAIEKFAPAVRLPTGSKPAGSFNANAFPAEIWLFDSIPLLDVGTWRLNVGGRAFSLSDLTTLHEPAEVQAVLDCTSGWWSEQVWSGIRLTDVLHSGGLNPEAVAAVSVTGHRIVLPLTDLSEAILATHVGGEPISPGHGYPLRLIVPGFRGYHWVKWLASLEPA